MLALNRQGQGKARGGNCSHVGKTGGIYAGEGGMDSRLPTVDAHPCRAAVEPASRTLTRSVEQGSPPKPLSQNANGPRMGAICVLAERVGFEPTKGYKPLLVFKTSAFNRSATSPGSLALLRARIVRITRSGFNRRGSLSGGCARYSSVRESAYRLNADGAG